MTDTHTEALEKLQTAIALFASENKKILDGHWHNLSVNFKADRNDGSITVTLHGLVIMLRQQRVSAWTWIRNTSRRTEASDRWLSLGT
jgi:hypothetical protein